MVRRMTYRALAETALRLVKENICPQAEISDISYAPRKSDMSIRLSARRASSDTAPDIESDKKRLDALLCEMPKICGINVFSGAYFEAGYINFTVNDAFLLHRAEEINAELPGVRMPDVIELPESPEFAAVKLMNFAQVFSEFPMGRLNRRALLICLGLEETDDKPILKRRLRAAVKAVLAACGAKNAVLGGKPAAAMTKLIARAAEILNNPKNRGRELLSLNRQ